MAPWSPDPSWYVAPVPAPIEILVADNYPRLATDLLAPILDLLRLSREHCGGDVDKFLVMLEVALRTSPHPDFAACTPDQLISGDIPIFPGLGSNARSIADSLGMPRETVRRKVGELIASGWLVRRRARLYFTAAAYQALAPVRVQIERLAIQHYDVVAALVDRSAPKTGRPRANS